MPESANVIGCHPWSVLRFHQRAWHHEHEPPQADHRWHAPQAVRS